MKDELNIYFLVEYIKGMELFDVIRDIGTISFSLPISYLSQGFSSSTMRNSTPVS